jgi:hypothetical protein
MKSLVNFISINDSYKCPTCQYAKRIDNLEPCNSCGWDEGKKRGKEWRGKE